MKNKIILALIIIVACIIGLVAAITLGSIVPRKLDSVYQISGFNQKANDFLTTHDKSKLCCE